jgi:hypothetical protein
MPRTPTVVVINSLSFTGTTWINLVLGSHPRAFALGPPDRVMKLTPKDAGDACRVHAASCPFWPGFFASYDPAGNFFVQLAEHADRDVIVTNNPIPDGAGRELDHPGLRPKQIYVVRDGRAIAASHHRKYPDTPFLESVRDWLLPSLSTFPFDPDDPDRLCLRYEDVLADQPGALARLGDFVGLEYDERALAYWEHEHHVTAGNAGSIMMIKLAQSVPVGESENRAFYAGQLEALRADPRRTFTDERWHDELSPRDRFVFDALAGAVNERYGYERDRFTVDEMRTFEAELGRAVPALAGSGAAGAGAPPRRRWRLPWAKPLA